MLEATLKDVTVIQETRLFSTDGSYNTTDCLHQLIEQQVERTPEATAVFFEQHSLTYQDLNQRANQLAHYLCHLGVGPNVIVGIAIERSFDMLIGLLAILKAGGAYVPLDPRAPGERLSWMIADIQPSVLLTCSTLLDQLPDLDAHINLISLDADKKNWHDESRNNPQTAVQPQDLAYVIYTSGSTGNPKGVMISHKSICFSLAWMQEEFQLTHDDHLLQKTPFIFDASLWELFWPLMTGAKITIARPEGHKDSAYMVALTHQQRITVLFFIPSMLQVFLEEPELAACGDLRLMLCGGETLSVELQERFFENHPATLYNLYGPTEAAIQVTYWKCRPEEKVERLPIGKPISNTYILLLDEQQQPVPIGYPGELYIGGESLAVGYWNRPDLTEERFIPDPFAQRSGARLYRTGDLARYRPDYEIEYLGRTDQQIKLRGNRIELGEIEAILTGHPAIQHGAVLLREDHETEKYLVAYAVLRSGMVLTLNELRAYLRTRLPDYMLPGVCLFLDEMPLTASGKINRLALPEPEQRHQRNNRTPIIAPRTPTEETLVHIWQDLLHLPEISIDDNFFDLGGHSLQITQATARIRQMMQVEIPLQCIFEAPTIERLAERIEALAWHMQAARKPITPTDRRDALPLSFGQERLWMLDQFAPRNTACNVPIARRLSGLLQQELLAHSFSLLVKRHKSLRTTFYEHEGHVQQIIQAPYTIQIPLIDLQASSPAEQEEKIHQITKWEANQPFNLVTGPLLRILLLKQSEREHILLLTIHHIITDGWSMSILMRELSTIYNALSQGKEPILPELPFDYTDYALWQRESTAAGLWDNDLSYWKQQLAGAPTMLDLPTRHSRPSVQSYNGARQTVTLAPELIHALKELSQRENVTLFMTLLASFKVLLLRYSGQSDIVIGAPIANRTRPEMEHVTGLYINTIVLRTSLKGNPTFRDLLRRMKEVALGAYAHQELPFEKLVESLQIERSLSHAPLFQVFFTLQNGPLLDLYLDNLTWRILDVEQNSAKFDLSLTLTEHPDGLATELEYNTDLFDQSNIEHMLEHWQNILVEITRDCQQPIEEIPLLMRAEEQQQFVDWNATEHQHTTTHCLHQLIEEQTRQHPSHTAIIFEESTLTYNELNQRANQFAHYLQKMRVGPDTLVAVYMKRSLSLLIALLGILKAGGAYLPLDPGNPQERLNFMLEDARPVLLISQEHLRSACPSTKIKTIYLNRTGTNFSQEPDSNPATNVTPAHLAYVIYTSGSTGKPKGVMNTHQGICNNLHWKQHAYAMTPDDRVLQKTPLSFDVSVWELFLPLTVGATVILAHPDGHKDSSYLLSLIKEQRVTAIEVVPSLLQVLIEEPTFTACNHLRLVICGGDTLSYELQERFFACHGAVLYNTYGPTEAAIDASYWICQRGAQDHNVPIGFPIDNTQLYILDRHQKPVPAGVHGELYIGGESLARGYLNRPDLTAERFIAHPFSTTPGARLYRTGDLARYRADGAIEYLGRIDQQIKLRGFRIEPGEIEAVMQTHPSIQESVALLKEDQHNRKFLVAYATLQHGEKLTGEDLCKYLSLHLPSYMIPTAIILLTNLPFNGNGKVDRLALSKKTVELTNTNQKYIAPRNSIEQALAEIWRDLLEIDQVGIMDNFFELGGHSLLAMQLLMRIKQRFQIELPLATFFQVPTIAQEASLLQQEEEKGSFIPSPIVTINSTGNKAPFFCVHPISGEAYSYLKLANYLMRDRAFYGIQAQGLHKGQATHTSIEAMAAYYIAELRAVQPRGPYLLGGYSFGGLVAFEMARQLEAAGEKIALLALMDPILYQKDKHGPLALLHYLRKRHLKQDVRGIIGLIKGYTDIMVTALYEQMSQPRPENQIAYLFDLLIKMLVSPWNTNAAQVRRFIKVMKANEQCRRHYRPAIYNGPLTLFCHEEENYHPRTTWSALTTRPFDLYTIPGDHLTMIAEPNVAQLAAHLQHCFDATDTMQ